MNSKSLQVTNHDFLIYKDGNNEVKISVMLINNDLWLTQDLIAELFGTARSTITEHINNILNDGELSKQTSVGISDISSGGRKPKIYNLDMIIAVGYRVNSKKATNFRIWATKVLKEYMIKGVVMDDERLKNPNYIFGEDYFEETLERIRNIRSSERRFYQKITDIYSRCSIDYDKDAEITKKFFKTVQNKLHYAVTGNETAGYSAVSCDNTKAWYSKVFKNSYSWTKLPANGSSANVRVVYNDGRLNYVNSANGGKFAGVRPVITISKSVISQ